MTLEQELLLKMATTDRRPINHIWFYSRPRAGYQSCWMTENGRAVLRKRFKGARWILYIDGNRVGSRESSLVGAVQFNEWAIRKVL